MTTYFAHRGLSSRGPENTLAAFRLAAEHGFTWFETDVNLSKDGVPVVLHDTDLDRTTNMSGSLYEYTVAELEKADAGAWFGADFAGEKLPTLADLVDLMNELGLNGNIELKPHLRGKDGALKLIDAVIEELENLDEDREVIISSFDYFMLAEFKKRAPHYATAALMGADMLKSNWFTTLEFIDSQIIHPDHAALTPDVVEDLLAAELEINAWTVNSRARANQLLNWGVQGIITDYTHNFVDLEKFGKTRHKKSVQVTCTI